jgi:oligopeptidase A
VAIDASPDCVDLVSRLSERAREFAGNLASATRDFAWHVAAPSELAGLPPRDVERARHRAHEAGLDGYLLTLDAHSFAPAMARLEDRALRKTLYEAMYTRASDRGPRAGRFDNTAVLSDILELRYQLARQSGCSNYAALALRDGVITEPDAAEAALLGSHRGTRASAQAELDTLWAFAKEKGVPRGFSNWDLPYYLTLWQRERLGFDANALRDYFELGASLEGALGLARRGLGVTVSQVTGSSDPHVRRYVVEEGGVVLGQLEVDPFGAGALLGEATVTPNATGVRIECGFERPWDDATVILLEHSEVETLFRCVGRALFLLRTRSFEAPSRQALLGSSVAGYLYESFASHTATLGAFARHCQTGEPLSAELLDTLTKSRSTHAALDASARLEMELFDIRVHRDHIPAAKATQLRVQVLDTFTQVRREQSVLPASYWTRFANISTALFVHDEGARSWEHSWARKVAADLFNALVTSSDPLAAATSLRDTLFDPAGAGVLERLSRALGQSPTFGR